STLARLQAAAADVGLRDRIAAMTPSTGSADGGAGDRVALRVAGASLAETVGMLHALAADTPSPRVERFALHKHPDDATRFDLVLEASQPRRARPRARRPRAPARPDAARVRSWGARRARAAARPGSLDPARRQRRVRRR